MSEIFKIMAPKSGSLPILISCPHVGTEIPPEIATRMHPALVRQPPDTDWFVHQLYDFAPSMGITLIHARYSRYVVDLNRSPEGGRLYADGRRETGLVPEYSFGGEPLYHGDPPSPEETAERVRRYHQPYHDEVNRLLAAMKGRHGRVLFFDAHSIRRLVPTIRPEPFPDMILGDQQGRTAARELSAVALASLQEGGAYSVSHNDPFMGGWLTRRTGNPPEGVHSLQLEMSQDIYMDADRVAWDSHKADAVRKTLKVMFTRLSAELEKLR